MEVTGLVSGGVFCQDMGDIIISDVTAEVTATFRIETYSGVALSTFTEQYYPDSENKITIAGLAQLMEVYLNGDSLSTLYNPSQGYAAVNVARRLYVTLSQDGTVAKAFSQLFYPCNCRTKVTPWNYKYFLNRYKERVIFPDQPIELSYLYKYQVLKCNVCYHDGNSVSTQTVQLDNSGVSFGAYCCHQYIPSDIANMCGVTADDLISVEFELGGNISAELENEGYYINANGYKCNADGYVVRTSLTLTKYHLNWAPQQRDLYDLVTGTIVLDAQSFAEKSLHQILADRGFYYNTKGALCTPENLVLFSEGDFWPNLSAAEYAVYETVPYYTLDKIKYIINRNYTMERMTFLFKNVFGVPETLPMTGQNKRTSELIATYSWISRKYRKTSTDLATSHTICSGWIDDTTHASIKDAIKSDEVYIIENLQITDQVTITDIDLDYTTPRTTPLAAYLTYRVSEKVQERFVRPSMEGGGDGIFDTTFDDSFE